MIFVLRAVGAGAIFRGDAPASFAEPERAVAPERLFGASTLDAAVPVPLIFLTARGIDYTPFFKSCVRDRKAQHTAPRP